MRASWASYSFRSRSASARSARIFSAARSASPSRSVMNFMTGRKRILRRRMNVTTKMMIWTRTTLGLMPRSARIPPSARRRAVIQRSGCGRPRLVSRAAREQLVAPEEEEHPREDDQRLDEHDADQHHRLEPPAGFRLARDRLDRRRDRPALAERRHARRE